MRQNGRVPEHVLPGGFINDVVRVGATVRRRPPVRAEFVRQLLGLLAGAGWSGAPRFLGVDEQGREILSFLAGHVAWEPMQPAEVVSDESLVRVAELVREFHDLTAGSALAEGADAGPGGPSRVASGKPFTRDAALASS